MAACTSGAGSANVTFCSRPPARMRPTPLAFARRNHGLFGPYRGTDVEVVAGPDDPHRHVGTYRAVRARGRELPLLGLTNPAQLLSTRRRHLFTSWIANGMATGCGASVSGF